MAQPPSDRIRVRRHPERGVYDRDTLYAILDEAPVCHVGFVHDGQPIVLPTIHARLGDRLYLHGAIASTMLRSLAGGAPACVTVTLLDGLVLARSVYNHSMNYRSAVVVGPALEVTQREEKLAALRALVDHIVPGRWGDARVPSEPELRATKVLGMTLDEASAKVRGGPPSDDAEDMDLAVWAGVVPAAIAYGAPETAPEMPGRAVPDYVLRLVEGPPGPARS